MSDPLKVKVEGPLAPLASGFREVLGASGYAPNSVAQHLQLIGNLSAWMHINGLDVHHLSPSAIKGFFGQRRRTHGRFRTPRALAPFISFLDAQGWRLIRWGRCRSGKRRWTVSGIICPRNAGCGRRRWKAI